MKAYETENTHMARNEAIDSGNQRLADIIWQAWKACDRIDPTWECDIEDFGRIIEVLREEGEEELAKELEAEAIKAYGC